MQTSALLKRMGAGMATLKHLLGPPINQPWKMRVDMLLLLLVAVGVGLLDALWMVRFHLVGWPLTASDFSQYCEAVFALRNGAVEQVPAQRSVVAGLLPALFASKFGVLGALATAAVMSTCVLVGAIYLWTRTLAGREAGVMAALLTGAVGPLLLLTRTTTFYPEATAGIMLASSLSIAFLRWRNSPLALLAGISIGLALCLDVRGILYVLPAMLVSCWAAVFSPGGLLWRGLRVFLLLGPVYMSWWIAHSFVNFETPGLLYQTAFFLRDAQRMAGHAQWVQIWGHDFLWGRSLPGELPAGVMAIQRVMGEVAQQLAASPSVAIVRDRHVEPWFQPMLVAVVGMIWALRRQPLWLLTTLGLLGPYLSALGMATQILPHPRYLGMAMAPLPVVLGLGAVGVFQLAWTILQNIIETVARRVKEDAVDETPPKQAGWPVACFRLALVLVLVLGVLPSPLSPTAAWRFRLTADEYPRVLMQAPRKVGPNDPGCLYALSQDTIHGRTWSGFGISTHALMPADVKGDVIGEINQWRPGPGDKPGRPTGQP
ncbi:MAG: hypothetical protein ACKO6N_28635 [Myxococcota bacterium]